MDNLYFTSDNRQVAKAIGDWIVHNRPELIASSNPYEKLVHLNVTNPEQYWNGGKGDKTQSAVEGKTDGNSADGGRESESSLGMGVIGFRNAMNGLFGGVAKTLGLAAVVTVIVVVLYRNRQKFGTLFSELGNLPGIGKLFQKLDFLNPDTATVVDPKYTRMLARDYQISYNTNELESFMDQAREVEGLARMSFAEIVKLKIALDSLNVEKAIKFARVADDGQSLSESGRRQARTNVVVR